MKKLINWLLIAMVCLSALPAFGQAIPRRAKIRKDKVAKAFGRLDLNHDGRITPGEWRRKPKAFDRIDANHDGAVTLDEFRAYRAARRTR